MHEHRIRIEEEEVEDVHDEVVVARTGWRVSGPVGHRECRNSPSVPERAAVFEERKPLEPQPDEIVRQWCLELPFEERGYGGSAKHGDGGGYGDGASRWRSD